jgi:hypothetical protein
VPGPIARTVIERLKKVRKSGSGWTALCPAHEDRDASLSLGEGADGRVLVTCHAGCSFEDIAGAIGMAAADFFPPREGSPYTPPARRASANGTRHHETATAKAIDEPTEDRRSWPVVAAYDYRDANGGLVFQVLRKEPPIQLEGAKRRKTFVQRRPEGGEWTYNLDGIDERPLYRLPELAEDLALGRTILLVEGEKDAETARGLGIAATAHAGGSKGWRDEYARQLAGADVVVIPDNDDQGREWAAEAGAALCAAGARVRMVAVPIHEEHTDLTDWVTSGADAAKVARFVNRAKVWVPGNPVPKPEPASRFHVYSDTELATLPPLRFFVDGVFPEDSLLCVYGPPGCGKSFLSLDLACAVSTGLTWLGRSTVKGPVLYVAAEGGRGYRKRVMAWKDARYIEQSIEVSFILEPANLHGTEDVEHILRAADTLPSPPSLVVFDTLHRSMTGGDENSAQDIGLLMDRAGRLRRELPASVLFIHHTRKDGDAERGSLSIRGSVDTLAQVRETDDDWRELVCEKQKDFDEFSPIKFDLRVQSESCVIRTFDPLRESKGLTPRQRDALRALNTNFGKGATSQEWLKVSGMPERTFYLVRGALVTQGMVSELEKGNSHRYLVTETGRQTLLSGSP